MHTHRSQYDRWETHQCAPQLGHKTLRFLPCPTVLLSNDRPLAEAWRHKHTISSSLSCEKRSIIQFLPTRSGNASTSYTTQLSEVSLKPYLLKLKIKQMLGFTEASTTALLNIFFPLQKQASYAFSRIINKVYPKGTKQICNTEKHLCPQSDGSCPLAKAHCTSVVIKVKHLNHHNKSLWRIRGNKTTAQSPYVRSSDRPLHVRRVITQHYWKTSTPINK